MRRRTLTQVILMGASAWLVGCDETPVFEPPEDAQVPAYSASRGQAIRGQYIIVLNDNVSEPGAAAGALAALHGLQVRHTYRHTIKGFAATVPGDVVAALERDPLVQSVEPDQYMYIDTYGKAAPALVPPIAPSNLAATAIGEQQIDLVWNDNSNDEESFAIGRRIGQTGEWVLAGEVGPNVTVFSDMGLDPATQYCYIIVALRGAEWSLSNVACATTAGPPPAAPTDLVATAVGLRRVDIAWMDNSDDEEVFYVARQLGPLGPYEVAGGVFPNVTTFSDRWLDPETEYCYVVVAMRGSDFSLSNTDCATTATEDPPVPPDKLAASAVAAGQVDLSWGDRWETEDSFVIGRRIGQSGAFALLDQVGANTAAFSDLSVGPETEYCYVVIVVDDGVSISYSNVDCATTPPAPVCSDTGNHDDLGQLWNILKVKANLNPTWQATQQEGCEITVQYYGLDTGVDSDHPDLNVVEIRNFVASEPAETGEDGNGHGTHTAGTAAGVDGNGGVVGVAPGAPVFGFRVCNDSGLCPNSDIIAGIDEVTGRKNANPDQPMVANMSLGGGASNAMDTAVRRSINAGVVFSISAGNGLFGACIIPADAQGFSPARTGDDDINASDGSNGDTRQINGALTTTSSDQNDQDVDCNFGSPVSMAAPGEGVRSAWLGGGSAVLSGTSMAAPHAAGAAMLYLHNHPNATPSEVEQAIVDDLDPWTTNDLPNASGRLNVESLGVSAPAALRATMRVQRPPVSAEVLEGMRWAGQGLLPFQTPSRR